MTREDLADWRAQRQIFEGIESYGLVRLAVLSEADRTESIRVGRISPGLVDFLGHKPKLGRGFTSEDAIIGNDHVVLLSEGLWRRMFGADPLSSVERSHSTISPTPSLVCCPCSSGFRQTTQQNCGFRLRIT